MWCGTSGSAHRNAAIESLDLLVHSGAEALIAAHCGLFAGRAAPPLSLQTKLNFYAYRTVTA